MSIQPEEIELFEAEYALHKKYEELLSQINSSSERTNAVYNEFYAKMAELEPALSVEDIIEESESDPAVQAESDAAQEKQITKE